MVCALSSCREMGMKKKEKVPGKVGRRPRRQAPRRTHERPPCPSAARASPPPYPAFHKQTQCRIPPSPGDARGEAPCIRKPKPPPSPPGKGVGGMGASKQAKGSVGRRQRRQAPPSQPAFHKQIQCRIPPNPGDARGEAPCMRKLKIPPLPRRGRGSGGWGQNQKLK